MAPLVEIPADRQAREVERARAYEAGERQRARYLFLAPLCILAFWALVGSFLFGAAAATPDPGVGAHLALVAPVVTLVGDAACLLAWFVRAGERDLL